MTNSPNAVTENSLGYLADTARKQGLSPEAVALTYIESILCDINSTLGSIATALDATAAQQD